MLDEHTILRNDSPSVAVLALFGAVLLHALLFVVPWTFRASPSEKQEKDPIVVERWDDTELPRQTVQTSRAEEQLESGKARFRGEFKNRVEKETRSPMVGRFREGPQSGNSVPDGKEGRGLTLSDLMPYGSQSDYLPDDVELGAQTLLNTDPFRYSSFLNRVHDEVHGPWSRRVSEAVRTIEEQLREKTYVTKLLVSVDDAGHVVSIRTLQSSGIPLIDQAAKQAFWDSEPFPDPPSDFNLREQGGPLAIGYEFHVSISESSFFMVPWRL